MKSSGQAIYEVWQIEAREAILTMGVQVPDEALKKKWLDTDEKTKGRFQRMADAGYEAQVLVNNAEAKIRVGAMAEIDDDVPLSDSFVVGINIKEQAVMICLKDIATRKVTSILSLPRKGAQSLITGLLKNIKLLEEATFELTPIEQLRYVPRSTGVSVASGEDNTILVMGGTTEIRSVILLNKPGAVKLRALLKEAIEYYVKPDPESGHSPPRHSQH